MSERYQERNKKAQDLRDMDQNPYPYAFDKTHDSTVILASYEHLKEGDTTEDVVSVAGRIMTFRKMGKVAFVTIRDDKGDIQLFFRQNDIPDTFDQLKLYDIGDFIGAQGKVFRTKAGEISVWVQSFSMLAKGLIDLPEKYHGLKDPELRYRQRYVDLMTNTEVKEVFRKRSAIVKAVRDFFHERNFMEVETPSLQTQYGGANATPFITKINAWDMQMFLSISPELYLKRLLVGGYERVFTICKNFRNEGVDHSHNPEFTMLEAYQAYGDYNTMTELIEQLFEYVALQVNGTTKATIFSRAEGNKAEPVEVDFKAPWPRMTMLEAIQSFTDMDLSNASLDDLQLICNDRKIQHPENKTWGNYVLAIFDELVEYKITQPTHIIDRPQESSPLCKRHRNDERLIEQNEPVIAGMEVANIYSELNDPIVQKAHLESQAQQLRGGDDEAHPMDEDFIRAIEYGMPPTAGIGIGIDRMVMMLTGQSTIREVIFFPTTRPKED